MEISRVVIFMLFLLKTIAITLKDGGYEDVYVLIYENNKESDELIPRIKEALTSASKLLFTATHNRLYFRDIKIIVPKTWSQKQGYKRHPVPPLKDSFLSVDSDGPGTPQAIGHFMCGKPGHYMHLSPKFLLAKKRSNWGLHDRVIVHEWAHLRWGLFNELPTKGKHFYQADGKWIPTRCTDEIKGSVYVKPELKQSVNCDIHDPSKLMHEACRFSPYSKQDVVASLMSYPFIDKLSEFCDDDIDTVKKEHRHLRLAPTEHNKMCNHRSAWEVMRLHSDFENLAQLDESTNTIPTFEIIQETTSYRVFVLDVSGSMDGRLKTLHQAMTNILQQLISKGSWVGIVSFSTTARVEKELTEVNTEQDRNDLIAAIPNTAAGWTCIGCGLQEANKMLTTKLGRIAHGEIILMSDGKNSPEHVDVDVYKAKQEVQDAKITVHTIAVSQQADHLLGDIARDTGGKYLLYLDNGDISLLGAFSQSLSSGQSSARKKNVMLMSHKIDSVKTKKHNLSFALEEGLGNETSVTVITSTDTNFQLQLSGPNDYHQVKRVYGNIATLSIPGTAQPGEYEMTVTTDTIPKTVEYYVKSDAYNGDIIRVTSLLSTNEIDLSSGNLPIIYSEVSKGYLPVLNATVTARVETGDNSCNIRLKDDGIDPDSFIDDGKYSGYILPNCLHSGRVNVKVDVKGKKGETKVLQSITGAPSEVGDDDDSSEVYNSSFQRVEVLEQLNVSNYKDSTSSDWIAPGKINDVSIYHIQSKASSQTERRNFTITWTATGDDKSLGRAARYIFRIADDFDDLLHNFENATLLDVKNTSLVPKPSGETEVLKLVVDADEKFTGTAFFAVQAVDETGNKGNVSNIISIAVAKNYQAFSEEGTLDIDKTDTVSSAGCFRVVFTLATTSVYVLFSLM